MKSECFMYYQGSLPSAMKHFPIGKLCHANFPSEGIYKVLGHKAGRDSAVEILGSLILPTKFGYPDEAFRGHHICEVLNLRETFARDESGWRLRNSE